MDTSISISVLSEENAAVNAYGSIVGDQETTDNSTTEACCYLCDTTMENFSLHFISPHTQFCFRKLDLVSFWLLLILGTIFL